MPPHFSGGSRHSKRGFVPETRTHVRPRVYLHAYTYECATTRTPHFSCICARMDMRVSTYTHGTRINTYMYTHAHTSGHLHARTMHTHVCARMYIRVHPYTQTTHICARVCIRVHPYTHTAHICARMHIPVSPTRTRHEHTCLCTHVRKSAPLHP